MSKLKLECDGEQFDCLHTSMEATRSTSLTTKVNKASLAALLRDHAKLVHLFRKDIE